MLSTSKNIISSEMKKYLQNSTNKYIEKCKENKNGHIVYVKVKR
jgi:hypothetical protein